ncbi:MAG: serine--tRNA ligase [Halobacteriovoraceae bacterium]|nr:serine--tRNA ligase [Halobacteriovoraceae bacterium]|tara:strand:- start:184 stop:1452 length:1269 start_codon:yes stop_codon:yes gene_type:complete
MHDIKHFETNTDQVKNNLSKRGFDISLVDSALELNLKRKKLTTEVESNQAEIKKLSKEVGSIKKNGGDASSLMEQVQSIKASMQNSQDELEKTKIALNDALAVIPNLLDESTPEGGGEEDNVEVSRWGEPRSFEFPIKDHVELGENLGQLDFEAAAKLTGARFVVYKKGFARLERALANFMLDHQLERGYQEIIPPFIVHERSLFGTGQLPKFSEDLFKIEGQDWYLIPTSEVPLTNLKREEVFDETELPLKYTGLTPCFRSEAGSHGKDTRGLIRMHQFNKVEMVNIVHPEKSDEVLEEMVRSAEELLEKLNLPYRKLQLCTGDIGFGSRKTYDLEVWVPSQNTYREISSCSNCGDFQARRAGIRFKKQGDKPQFAHTLNGSGLAVGRTLVAVVENYQNEDGTITVPQALIPYMGGLEKID